MDDASLNLIRGILLLVLRALQGGPLHGWAPARRAARVDPMDAVRGE